MPTLMSETGITGAESVPGQIRSMPRSPLSWSAAIAGAFTATAVTLMIIALGSGIGLSFASPYGAGPSATSLTIIAAIWLLIAESWGFAVGGYMAARLRSPAYDTVVGETTFRDAAQGFLVWGLGVVATAATLTLVSMLGAGASARLAAGVTNAASAASRLGECQPDRVFRRPSVSAGFGCAEPGSAGQCQHRRLRRAGGAQHGHPS